MNDFVLLVDDDLDVLSAFQRNLRKSFKIKAATSAIEALEIIRESQEFAVIVSDYNMPHMNGIEFLTLVRKFHPDTVRIMLTGFANLETSIKSVNEGNVFRFLTKPVNIEVLSQTIEDALAQYHLITFEKELLDKTLRGSIKVLIDILSAVNPTAFSIGASVRNTAKMIAEKLDMKNLWEVDLACLLSQIGCVAVPAEILQKKINNESLGHEELKIFNSHPSLGRDLLKNIPKLESIAEAIFYQFRNYDGSDNHEIEVKHDAIPLIARILKVATDYEDYIKNGFSEGDALAKLQQFSDHYDPKILETLKKDNGELKHKYIIRFVELKQLRMNMILADDIRDIKDNILIVKGKELTDIHLLQLINQSKVRTIREPIKVIERVQM
ncbi:MAG: response regulator [Candidatus Kapabacteria bacterium]|nr:response regulator [Candidatus Kapabacteria bacterium]